MQLETISLEVFLYFNIKYAIEFFNALMEILEEE
jgi:hypothetical protein